MRVGGLHVALLQYRKHGVQINLLQVEFRKDQMVIPIAAVGSGSVFMPAQS